MNIKNFIIYFTIAVIVISCNTSDSKELSDEELTTRIDNPDSLQIEFDSLMKIDVEIPAVFDYSIVNYDCVESFNALARSTGGELKVVANSSFVTRAILDIVENHAQDNSDIMIILDKTQSMEDDLDNIKKGLIQIVRKLEAYSGIRLSMATYGDKNVDGNKWYDYNNFESDFSSSKSFIEKIRVTGGGDYPESVYDGIYEAFSEGFWESDNKRIVILLGDAPSLDSDSTLAEYDATDIISLATTQNINMNFYPIVLNPNPNLDDSPHMESLKLIDNIYPNPTTGLLSVVLNSDEELTLEIFDQSGKIMKSEQVEGPVLREDLSSYDDGVYIIRVYDERKNFDSRKVILSK
ncbi:MAG: hypothetical protein ACI8ZM_000327 [Crocinitomix sp.]|jgi:hypothetical protein